MDTYTYTVSMAICAYYNIYVFFNSLLDTDEH